MFYEFSHRHTDCTVDGAPDKVILSRDSRATSVIGKEYSYNGVFAPDSPIQTGSLVETSDSFFVQTLRLTTNRDKNCSLIKTNVTIEVKRYQQALDGNDNPVSAPTFNTIRSNVKAFAQYVTAHLRQQDPGLLPSTVYVLQLQSTVDDRKPQDPSLISPDRIILNGRPYQVDAVDDVKYPNLLHVQLSEDLR
jgi:hypothetical protein